MELRKVLILTCCVVACFGMIVSYDVSVMSGALLFLENSLSLSLRDKQHLVSLIILGALAGVLIAGPISDRFGRKKTWFVACFFYLSGGMLSVLAHSVNALMMARFTVGVGLGILSVIVPVYLAEISPAQHRGKIVSSFQLFITLGILLSYFVNWSLSSSQNWKLSLAVGPGLAVIGTLFLSFLPETLPKKEVVSGSFSEYKKPLLIGVGLSIFQQITGINTVIYYSPTILGHSGFSDMAASLLATLGIGAINVIATLISLRCVDTFGRRPLLLVGLIGMVLSLFCLSTYINYPIPALLSITGYVISFAIGLGVVVGVVVSEIFPQKFRSRAVSIALFFNWLTNYGVVFSFLDLANRIGMRALFRGFAALSLLAFLFVFFLVSETKGSQLKK